MRKWVALLLVACVPGCVAPDVPEPSSSQESTATTSTTAPAGGPPENPCARPSFPWQPFLPDARCVKHTSYPPPSPSPTSGSPTPCQTKSVVSWMQEGVYELVPAEGRRGSFTFDEWGLRGSGVPLDSARYNQQWVDPGIGEIRWNGTNAQRLLLLPHEPPTLLTGVGDQPFFRMIVTKNASRDDLRNSFLEFARAVLDANESALDEFADAFVASRQDWTWYGLTDGPDPLQYGGDFHGIPLGPPYRIDALLDALWSEGNPKETAWKGFLGRVSQVWPEWNFTFFLPVHQAFSGEKEGDFIVLAADSDQRLQVDAGYSPVDSEEMERRIRAAFGELGLPEPDLRAATFEIGRCPAG